MRIRYLSFILLAAILSFPLGAKTAWEEVAPPSVDSVEIDGKQATVNFTMATGSDGADRGTVYLMEDGSIVASRAIGRSSRAGRNATFELDHSGSYIVFVESERRTESDKKRSGGFPFSFTLPLSSPDFSLKNTGDGKIEVNIGKVDEAESYIVTISEHQEDDILDEIAMTESGTVVFPGTPDTAYDFSVTAIRGSESITAGPVRKTCREDAERDWNFAWFGQSTKESLNRVEIVDSDNLTLRLYSTAFDDKGVTVEKGGKFTALHDGISYFYTEFDPYKENFELSATFTIDYINPTADGQEGFGILAMDSLGQHGVSSANHYTNSAGIIATKFEETINGTKHTSKDTLGARFVTGLTEEIINGGDSLIAENGKVTAHAYSYDQSALIKQGDVYRITLKKDNTGYHAIYRREIKHEDTIEEYILYDWRKLEVINPDVSYVGFAVARGCNATVSDITLTVTDPKTDPPAEKEPDELVPLIAKVDSTASYSGNEYPFVFVSNADGLITVKDQNGNLIVDNAAVKADQDFEATFALSDVINSYQITFSPDASFRPGEKMTIAQYDRIEEEYKEDYSPVSIQFSVIHLSYPGEKLYVSKDGSIFGNGSKENPLDLDSALRYSAPGQTIVLPAGEWVLYDGIIIERGNSGKEGSSKTITCEDGRCIFDFAYNGNGMQIWGDWWVMENVDITNTPDNIKGLQIAGDHNIVRNVRAYRCGDTGIQISGTSLETWDKWPHDNLVIGCISHDNKDSAENNADGFAAKLTAADGNRFINCIAYSNIDDGWDLYSKIESGPIGEVEIIGCVAYGNGSLSDGSGKGDGNGFKLGGDGIAISHRIVNSTAFSNGQAGITSNSNPSLIIENVTSYGNGSENIALYGKGNAPRAFMASGVLSMSGTDADNISEQPDLASESNFFFDGAESRNSEGRSIGTSIFLSTDTSITPALAEDLSIEMNGLLEVIDESVKAGARH